MPHITVPVTVRLHILDKCLRDETRRYDIDALVDACERGLRQYGQDCDIHLSKRTIQADLTTLKNQYGMDFANMYDGHNKLYRYENVKQRLILNNLTREEKGQLGKAIDVIGRLGNAPQFVWAKIFLSIIQSGVSLDADEACVEFQNVHKMVGMENFPLLLDSCIRTQPLCLLYEPFGKEPRKIIVSPHILKQYNERWFLLAKEKGRENLSTYALDRIKEVNYHSAHAYEYCSLPAPNYIGVTNPQDKEPEMVTLHFSPSRYPYVKSKPIHRSQRDTSRTTEDGWKEITLYIKINKELEQTIFSFGADVEVVQPIWLRERIKEKISALLEKYK